MCKTIEYKPKTINGICVKVNDDFYALNSLLDEKLKETIRAFNGINHEPINKADLLQFKVGKWYHINKDVRIRKRKERFKTYLNFDTEIKKGGGFGGHFHEDLIESTEVVSGAIRDLTDNELYLSGDVMEYGKGIIHEPIAEEDTFLHVLFKP